MSLDTEAVAISAANGVYRKFSSYVDREDLQQEARLWMYEHGPLIARHCEADEDKVAEYRVQRDASMHLEKYARAQKASISGYLPEDEAWYSKGIIALVLPKVLTGDRNAPSAAPDGLPRAQNDPAEGNTWQAMFADVQGALKGMEDRDLHLLVDRYMDELTYDEIARRWGWGSTDTAHKAVAKAERRLIDKLGGSKPKGCSPETCEHLNCSENLRRRPGRHEELS